METRKFAAGTRDVQPGTQSNEMTQMNAVLKEQRKSFIDALKSELPAYLNYKFSVAVTEGQFDQIRASLTAFEQSPISENLCKQVLKGGVNAYNLFYNEVNEMISLILKPAQVELGINSGRTKEGIDTTDLNVLPD